MLAGDYLSYKGDWVTNTAYNVNECVTWTDGHLYEVIKAHTSSSTINPSNTEYYKAMTASKAETVTLAHNASITKDIMDKMLDAQSKGKQIIINLPTPNRNINIIPCLDTLDFYGYTIMVEDGYYSYKEYMLTGKKGSRTRLYFRNVDMSNPSSAGAFSEASISGNITITIGQ